MPNCISSPYYIIYARTRAKNCYTSYTSYTSYIPPIQRTPPRLLILSGVLSFTLPFHPPPARRADPFPALADPFPALADPFPNRGEVAKPERGWEGLGVGLLFFPIIRPTILCAGVELARLAAKRYLAGAAKESSLGCHRGQLGLRDNILFHN